MDGVYKFYIDCGRMGDLSGLFVANSEDVEKAIAKEKEVYFHDVLGKHSEISVTLSESNLTLVSSDPSVVHVVCEHDLSNGINPFDYFDMDELDEEESDEEE